MKNFQARQGDIFFRSISKLPEKVDLKKKRDAILAYGEVTSHAHKTISPPLEEMEMYTDENGDIYVMSKTEDIKVGHDEHNTITLPANEWICVSRQREYSPLEIERERKIRD
jgi:hypothetical protein